ncbi:hypothetical protein MTR67_034238 [Solanum verrucosum]|uniref:Reverse transcriptase zinc-binding domain-containing protein n=1 Tax=Solanum verrucosum TaxID=315347 RepID=A0AAF0U7E5_SOLVR|nr:hypothetical protein MTR67_034238 [Solanum verrucosum]
MWNLCRNKDKLWVAWIHSYYGQHGVWNIQTKQTSWIVQRIFKAAQYLQEVGLNEACVRNMESYSIVNGRLATKDRLAKWSVIQSPECPLCLMKNEDLDHMFFQCPYTAEVWRRVLTWQGINRSTMHWTAEVQWAERNSRIFTQKKQQTSTIVRHIIQEAHGRGSRYPKLANRLHTMNMYP